MGWMGVLGTTGSTVDGFTMVSDYVGHFRINFCQLLFTWCRPQKSSNVYSRALSLVTGMESHPTPFFFSVRLSSGGRHAFATVCLLVWLSLLTRCLLSSELTAAMRSDMFRIFSVLSEEVRNCWRFSLSTGTEWMSCLLYLYKKICPLF